MTNVSNKNILASFLMCTNLYDKKFKDAVNSCLLQSIEDIELIIVVNGVNEDEKNKISNFCKDQRIVLLFSSAKYLAYNLNLGLQACRSNFIARIDADDVAHPMRIEKQIEYLNNNIDVAVCGSSYRLIDENNQIIKSVMLPSSNKQIRRKLIFSNPIAHPSVMFRKDIILSLGGYMGGKYAQDYDLWLRIMYETNYKFYNFTDCLIDYRTIGSDARRSREAYANVSAARWRQFVLTFNPAWLFSALIEFLKVISR